MTIWEFIKGLFTAKQSKFEAAKERASIIYGSEKGQKYGNRAQTRESAVIYPHVGSALLSFFFLYSTFHTLFSFWDKEKAFAPAALISAIALFLMERFKGHWIDDATESLVIAIKKDYKQLELRALLLGLGICVLSWYMCLNGSEDFVRETTDKKDEIEQTHKSQKNYTKGEMETERKRLTHYHDSIIKAKTREMNDYKVSVSYKNKINESNKTVTGTLASYKKSIDELEADKRMALASVGQKETETLEELKGEAAKAKTENSGIVSMFLKYCGWISVGMELFLIIMYYEKNNYYYMLTNGESVPEEIEKKIESIGTDNEAPQPQAQPLPKKETQAPPPPPPPVRRPNINPYLDYNEKDLQAIYVKTNLEFEAAKTREERENLDWHLQMLDKALEDIQKKNVNNTVITLKTEPSPQIDFELENELESEVFTENTVITYNRQDFYPAKMNYNEREILKGKIMNSLSTSQGYLENPNDSRNKDTLKMHIEKYNRYLEILYHFKDND